MAEIKCRKGLARGIPKRRLGRRILSKQRIMPYSLIKAKHVSIRRAGAQPLGSPWDVLRFVLMTEKSVKVIEGENVIVFVAYKSANKFIISQAFEKAFGQKVAHVRTLIDQDGRKKAFVKLKEPGAASDVAIKLGVI